MEDNNRNLMFLPLSVWVRLRVPKLTSLTFINSSSSVSEDGVRCSFDRFVRFGNKNCWHTLWISFGVAVAQLMVPFAGTFAWAGNANSLARLAVIEHSLKRVYVRLHSKTNVLLLKPVYKNVASGRILQIGGIFISVQLLHLHFFRWTLAFAIFTPPCPTCPAYDGFNVASFEKTRRIKLLESGRICLFGRGHGPRVTHVQAQNTS